MITAGEILLGKYRIHSRLGEGGMGTVWRAHDELLDRDVAIKELRADLTGHEALAERFRAEAVALARLAHPGIASLHGLERDAQHFYMVMEFVPGTTLEAMVQREGPLPWPRAAALCAAACGALEHAHLLGVVHRDIKPANLMVTPAEQVKVMDFGIARMTGQARQTRHGSTIGTPHYMSPEQLRGEEVDGRADVYSLGAVLFELISGHVPFDADSDYKLMMMQLHDAPPRVSGEVPGVPSSIDRIIVKAMTKDSNARYLTAGAFREALLEAVRLAAPPTLPHGGSGGAGFPRAATDSTPLHRDWRTWAAAVMVLTAGGLLLRDGPPRPTAPPPVAPAATVPRALTEDPSPRPSLQGAGTPAPGGRPPIAPGGGGPPVVTPPRNVQRSAPPPSATPRQRPIPGGVTPPPPSPPGVAAPVERADPTPAIATAVRDWLGGLGRRQGGGISGQVDGTALAELVRQGRVAVDGIGTPRIEVGDERADATVTATLGIRSSFGAARKHPVRFILSLRESGGRWSVASGRVE